MDGFNLRYVFLRFGPAIILIMALQALFSRGLHSDPETPLRGLRLHNPFCAVPTYINRKVGTQGLALIEADGRGVIYIGREEALGDRAYRDFRRRLLRRCGAGQVRPHGCRSRGGGEDARLRGDADRRRRLPFGRHARHAHRGLRRPREIGWRPRRRGRPSCGYTPRTAPRCGCSRPNASGRRPC
jgi:hypothetical protein